MLMQAYLRLAGADVQVVEYSGARSSPTGTFTPAVSLLPFRNSRAVVLSAGSDWMCYSTCDIWLLSRRCDALS